MLLLARLALIAAQQLVLMARSVKESLNHRSLRASAPVVRSAEISRYENQSKSSVSAYKSSY